MNLRVHVQIPQRPPFEQTGRGGVLVLGRGDHCDIRIDHPSVAETHAILEPGPIVDARALPSALGGVPLACDVPRHWLAEAPLQIGSVLLKLRRPMLGEPRDRSERLQRELFLFQESLEPRYLVPSIVVVEGSGPGNTLRLVPRERPYRVGRDRLFELFLNDPRLGAHALDVRVCGADIEVRSSSGGPVALGRTLLERSYRRWDQTMMIRLGPYVLGLSHPLDRAKREFNERIARAPVDAALEKASGTIVTGPTRDPNQTTP